MSDVTSKVRRQQIAVRLNPAGLERVRELAAQETDGNVSLMVRKLLAEAIHHRDTVASSRRPSKGTQ